MYEVEDSPGSGQLLHLQVQADWKIFTFDDPEMLQRFLSSAVQDDHELLTVDMRVRLRTTEDESGTDHLSSWSEFSDEIRTRNRYFPQTVPDRKVLEDVLLQHVEVVHKDVALYRARVVQPGLNLTADAMGAPPPEKTGPGRANPVGIPYLYLSFSVDTCIYETRVANHTEVAIGTFYASRNLSVLNLADIEPPDFFDIEDSGDAVSKQVRRISFHRYLAALGRELTKPVRNSAQPTDYIPTQYLCELAKSLGLDGVLYSSSLHPPGRNLVIFDVNAATCQPNITVVRISSLQAEWAAIAPS